MTNGCCQAARPGLLPACYTLSWMERDVLPVIYIETSRGAHTSGCWGCSCLSLANNSYRICRLIDLLAQHRFRFDIGLGHLSPVSWCCPSDSHECMTRGNGLVSTGESIDPSVCSVWVMENHLCLSRGPSSREGWKLQREESKERNCSPVISSFCTIFFLCDFP